MENYVQLNVHFMMKIEFNQNQTVAAMNNKEKK